MKIDKVKRWDSFIARLRQQTEEHAMHALMNNRQRGCAIITANILVDGNGTPLAWVVSEGKRIEPSKDAARIIEGLVEGF